MDVESGTMDRQFQPKAVIMSLIVQFSDTHISRPGQLAYDRVDTATFLRQAVTAVLRLPHAPDAVVITGDLADHGRAEEYALLQELLTPLREVPVYLLPGNHDDRATLRQAFPAQPAWMASGHAQYSVAVGAMQLVVLDTVVPRRDEGALCSERLAWLDQALQQCRDRPTLIAMHHPPFRTMIDGMDEIGLLQGISELEAIICRHPQVQGLIAGHMHRHIQTRFGHARAMVAPSTAHQVALDLTPGAPLAWTLEPPGYLLHALSPEGRIITHQATTLSFVGPFPFG